MDEPEKPFSCRELGCGESFTNADRMAVHSKKHDLVLQLGNKGGTFVGNYFNLFPSIIDRSMLNIL